MLAKLVFLLLFLAVCICYIFYVNLRPKNPGSPLLETFPEESFPPVFGDFIMYKWFPSFALSGLISVSMLVSVVALWVTGDHLRDRKGTNAGPARRQPEHPHTVSYDDIGLEVTENTPAAPSHHRAEFESEITAL